MRTMSPPQVEKVLGALKTWSSRQPRVDALALVGSWASSRDHAECDLEVVCVVDDPDKFQAEQDWIRQIDWSSTGLAVKGWTEVDFGGARARHLTFDSGEEVEVNFVDRKWVSTEPVDPVTRRLAGEGLRVLHDPRGLLGKLLVAL